MKKIVFYIFIIFLISCEKDDKQKSNSNKLFVGNYNVIENFKITGGPMTGTTGRGEYTIDMYLDNTDSNKVYFYNFGGIDTVCALKVNTKFTIPRQIIQSQTNGVIYINSGSGLFYNDSLSYSYHSGSSAGIIESSCSAVKL